MEEVCFVIGSTTDADILIEHSTIDAKHCSIQKRSKGEFLIRDLGSSTGVFVDGERIQEKIVTKEQTITLGSYPILVMSLAVHFFDDMPTEVEAHNTAILDNVLIVGREAPSDILVEQPAVSGCHAELRMENDIFFIRDMGSTNGTFLNKKSIGQEWKTMLRTDSLHLGTCPITTKMLDDWARRFMEDTDAQRVLRFLFPQQGSLFIGRDPNCALSIDDPTISWRHAKIRCNGSQWEIIDLNSYNGTFVNGARIKQAQLNPFSSLRVGAVQLPLFEGGIDTSLSGQASIRMDVHDVDRILPDGKQVLHNIAFSLYPGEIVALMGPSGAGKTMLLEVVSGQKEPSSGYVRLNGQSLYDNWVLLRQRIGYVPQEDIMHRDLTVYEVLYHTARLKLPLDLPEEAIVQTVLSVMERMGLASLKDVVIGGENVRGISGGQRKRVNIAMELITEPSLLILDEPTSGLDATATLEVLEVLRTLADQGKAIILTIHQPRREAFNLIDNIVLLQKGGHLAYFGPTTLETIHYFERLALKECKKTVNPADYLMDVLDNSDLDINWSEAFVQSDIYQTFVVQRLGEPIDSGNTSIQQKRRPIFGEWWNLFRRYSKRKLRDKVALLIQAMQAPVIALLLGALFLGSGPDLLSMDFNAPKYETIGPLVRLFQLQNGLHPTLFLIGAAAFWLGCSNVAREIVSDFPVFLRERRSGIRVFSYISSIFVYQLLVCMVQTLMIIGCIWWLAAPSSFFLVQWGILILTSACGISMGMLLSSLAYTEVTAISLVPLLLLPQLMLGGFIKLYGHLKASSWQAHFADITPIRWAFESLAIIEYDYALQQNPALKSIDQTLGFADRSVWVSLSVLALMTLLNLLAMMMVLRLKSK